MTITVIHTGGTIGMARTGRGYAPREGVLEAALARLGRLDVDLVPLEPLIDSANAMPEDWNRIAAVIAERHEASAGFVVTHGTDTMAFAAAALCFALEGLGRPVVLTGAMLPLTEDGSDGARNLADALAAAEVAPAGVWLQFAGRLLHGARVIKTHSSDFDAFADTPAGVAPRVEGGLLRRHAVGRANVGILSMAPGLPGTVIETVLGACDGIVLRCYGSGTVPETAVLRRALEGARARQVPVLAVSQCAEGRIALGTYAAGSVLVDNAVVDGRDMSVEAGYAKMHHSLAVEAGFEGRLARLARALCGEMTG